MNRKTLMLIVVGVLGAASFPTLAGAGQPLADPIPEPIEQGHIAVRLDPVVSGMTAPNWGTPIPGCDALAGRIAVSDQDGILWAINLATREKATLLDVGPRLVALGVGGPGTFDERGLLGVAFHPEFAGNGLLYTYTSEPLDGPADFSTMPAGMTANHQSVVTEWQIPQPCEPASVVDPDTAREVLRIDEPQFNHDAGALGFGPSGMLYIALGDGGNADDQGVGHVPGGNGQEPDNVLGTILRIDPNGDDSANGSYGIPSDNPFVGQDGFADEVFAYGLRNPFRFSFDTQTGEMLIADVGQNGIEEINVGFAGANYGWRIKEGSFCFDPNGLDPGFVFECGPGDAPAGLVDPLAEYDHDEGIAVIGGFVYRGEAIPQLRGRYVFGDYLHPASGAGRLFYLHSNDTIQELRLADRDGLGLSLLGFGRDVRGELYVLANETGVPFGDTGVVLRIASAKPAQRNFHAHLSGKEEVPPVDTVARGQAAFHSRQNGSALDFKLTVANIDDVVAAHVHCAPEGVNGPVGVTLFQDGPVSQSGTLARGTIASPDPDNACNWTGIDDVLDALRSGYGYVNVHTLEHPSGEIRGQIR